MVVEALSKLARNRQIRTIVQLLFVALVLYKAYSHGQSPGKFPSLDALCPMGGVATLYRLFTEGLFVQKVFASAVILSVGLLVSVIIAGGAFCGWICPLGSLSDWLSAARRRLHIPEIKVSSEMARPLSVLRWVVLALVLYFTATAGQLAFAPYDPYRAIFSLHWLFEPSVASWPSYAIAIALIGILLFVERAWCRFLCPLGALIGLLSRLRIVRITRDPGACISCGLCTEVCPSRLPVDTQLKVGPDCVGCLDCVAACPAKGALNVTAGACPTSAPRQDRTKGVTTNAR